MGTRIARAGLAALVALGLAAPAAVMAKVGGSVVITLDNNFLTDGTETFTAAGAFCSVGSGFTPGFWQAGGWRAQSYHVVKTLTCQNGTDSITIEIDVANHGGGGVQGGWSVKSGTGAYADANGGGVIVGVYDEGGIVDVYSGRLSR